MSRYFTIFVFAVVVFAAAPAAAAVEIVEAEGLAERGRSEIKTKEAAIEDALVKAVTIHVSTFMTAEALEEDYNLISEVFSESSNFVLNYRILREGWITHHEKKSEAAEDEVGEAVLNVEAEEAAAAEDEGEADFDMEGESIAVADRVVRPAGVGVDYYHVWIAAKVDTGRLMAEVRKLTGYGEVRTAAVKVFVLGVGDYRDFEGLKKKMTLTGLVKEMTFESFYPGRVEMTVIVFGTAVDLTEKLSESIGESYILVPSGRSGLIIRSIASAGDGGSR